MEKLKEARKSGARTTLQVIDSMEALINHCCGVETNQKTEDPSQN